MDERIGIGLIVGLMTATSLYVYNSDEFSKVEKIVLLIFIVFPPLQWVSILILLGVKYYKEQNSKENLIVKNIQKQTDNYEVQIISLKELKDDEIITEEEFNQKVKILENSKLESQITLSEDYKKLKNLYDDGILTKEEFENKINILKSKTDGRKQPSKSKIHQRELIGVWKCNDMIFEFWLTGNFNYKRTNFKTIKGSWLYKNNVYNISLKDSNERITPISIDEKKLKIKVNGTAYICQKIKEEI